MKTATEQTIDPRTAVPCRTVAFSADGSLLAEANYLGFLTVRESSTGAIRSRFLAQTALVETIRFDSRTGNLLIVGAGFEGRRDFGAVKVLTFPDGVRIDELLGHTDDITDVATLGGSRHRIASVGLDKRVVVHDLDNRADDWIWSGYDNYLNMCSPRPLHHGHFAVAGDSPYTYVLDSNTKSIVAKIETPGDSNGLTWSEDGRFLIVGNDHSELQYFDAEKGWQICGSLAVGGAVKKTVRDPGAPGRGLSACYDGQIWSFPLDPRDKRAPFVEVPKVRGMWGINVDATKSRIAVPSFYDRAFLFDRKEGSESRLPIGDAPQATFGCNWIAVNESIGVLAITHDDGYIRLRNAGDGAFIAKIGGDSDSLFMAACFHPTRPLLATIDFYGEVWIYDTQSYRVKTRHFLPFGPGISVDFSSCGQFLVVGGYRWDAYVLQLLEDDSLRELQLLEKPNHGVIKSVAFGENGLIATAAGDGTAVVHERSGDCWVAKHRLSAEPSMELCNGVAICSISNRVFVVSRDQCVRAFDLSSGVNIITGFGHTRSIKSVDVSRDGRLLVTGSYDRSVMIWETATLLPVLPPVRFANAGISCVRIRKHLIYACSFDGSIACIDSRSGRILWSKDSYDTFCNQ